MKSTITESQKKKKKIVFYRIFAYMLHGQMVHSPEMK